MKYLIFVLTVLLTVMASSGVFAQQLYSSQLNCYGYAGANQLCNTVVSWDVESSYQNITGLVTVMVPSSNDARERLEKVMSCGNFGSTYVPWIRARDTYVFTLYATDNCYYIGGQRLNQIVVRK